MQYFLDKVNLHAVSIVLGKDAIASLGLKLVGQLAPFFSASIIDSTILNAADVVPLVKHHHRMSFDDTNTFQIDILNILVVIDYVHTKNSAKDRFLQNPKSIKSFKKKTLCLYCQQKKSEIAGIAHTSPIVDLLHQITILVSSLVTLNIKFLILMLPSKSGNCFSAQKIKTKQWIHAPFTLTAKQGKFRKNLRIQTF